MEYDSYNDKNYSNYSKKKEGFKLRFSFRYQRSIQAAAALLVAGITAFSLSGCGAAQDTPEVSVSQEVPVQASSSAVEVLQSSAASTEASGGVQAVSTARDGGIGVAKAQEIALADAGFTADQVTVTKAGFDYDDGIAVYDIKFIQGDLEYDYEIAAADGSIRERSQKTITTKGSGTAAATDSGIGMEKAQAIAMEHAGIKAEQATVTKARLDRDDGISAYTIEFTAGGSEYDYEISAADGTILEYSRDLILTAPLATGGDIGLEKAKEIALGDAGITADQATALKVEQDMDDGIMEYEVKFTAGTIRYDYTIHAATGTILSADGELRILG